MSAARPLAPLVRAFTAFTLAVVLLFGLFAMAFVYAVEDRVFERELTAESQRQEAARAAGGAWLVPQRAHHRVVSRSADLPTDLARVLAQEPHRREVSGTQGRHYHLRPLSGGAWLVAEVGDQLLVRPMRDELLAWLAICGAAVTLASLLLASWLARRFEAVLARTRAFAAREQAFTRDASHELRTPLAVLRLGLARLTGPSAVPLREAAAQMSDTLDALLCLAREAPAAPAAPTAVLPLVERWALTHADWLDTQSLRLEVAVPRNAALCVPPEVLHTALAGVLGNAFVHGTLGSVVWVGMDDAALLVRNPSAAPPPDAASPGVKGAASSGQGLGLAITQRLLAHHGARLTLTHAAGVTEARIEVVGAAYSDGHATLPGARRSP